MSLDNKDIELIEAVIYKSADDIAVSIARSFERLEERIDTTESRLYTRIADIDGLVIEVREILKADPDEEIE
ncbi:MAG: hypothetical protein WCK03_00125 [Candidatus Taylorbacteria bacterium]